MKTKKLVLIVALFMMPLSLIGCDREVPLTVNDVPNEIKTYVEKHFSDYDILQIMKDYDGAELTYDVILKSKQTSGLITLEFNRKKQIISIDSQNTCLPESVIPAPIWAYVSANYQNQNICINDWSFDRDGLNKHQEVELSNGLNLEFDKDGNFRRIDD